MITIFMFHNQKLASLSKESQGWLIAALDPYHDYQYDASGFPDPRTAPSVVKVHNQSITLTSPTSAGAGNFDASICYTGLNSEIGRSPAFNTQGSSGLATYDHALFPGTIPVGALTIWAGASGTAAHFSGIVTAGDTHACLGSVTSDDRCRLIGVAFEVHNTTAEVYRQGSMCVAQLADVQQDSKSALYKDSNALPHPDYTMQIDSGTVLASTQAPLLSVPGAQVWPASDGVYAIPRLTNPYVDLSRNDRSTVPRGVAVYGTDTRIGLQEPAGYTTYQVKTPLFDTVTPSGFSPVQAFFTGLSPASTLTITFRTIVEYFPALGSPLLPLAEPSPVYDPLVLGAYSAIIREAPYAVPVGQNAAGDYFRKILRVVSSALDVSSPMFGAYAPLVSLAAKGGRALSKIGEKSTKIDRAAAGPPAMQRKLKH